MTVVPCVDPAFGLTNLTLAPGAPTWVAVEAVDVADDVDVDAVDFFLLLPQPAAPTATTATNTRASALRAMGEPPIRVINPPYAPDPFTDQREVAAATYGRGTAASQENSATAAECVWICPYRIRRLECAEAVTELPSQNLRYRFPARA